MKRSLAIILPIHNVQGTLEAVVTELLDVVTDLGPRFEIVLIDDASGDDTVEVAHELARGYPQVQVVRHGVRLGRAAALRTGLAHSTGEIVLVRDAECQLDLGDVRKLWKLIGGFAAVIGRCTLDGDAPRGVGQWLREWGRTADPAALCDARGGSLVMMHRQVAQRLCHAAANCDDLMAELTRDGYRWCEVQLPPRVERLARPLLPSLRGVHRRADVPAPRSPSAAPARPAPSLKRPRYLDRIKAFALGE